MLTLHSKDKSQNHILPKWLESFFVDERTWRFGPLGPCSQLMKQSKKGWTATWFKCVTWFNICMAILVVQHVGVYKVFADSEHTNAQKTNDVHEDVQDSWCWRWWKGPCKCPTCSCWPQIVWMACYVSWDAVDWLRISSSLFRKVRQTNQASQCCHLCFKLHPCVIFWKQEIDAKL